MVENDTKKQILKGQCLNLCCAGITKETMNSKIELTKELYFELQKKGYFEW